MPTSAGPSSEPDMLGPDADPGHVLLTRVVELG